MLTVGFTVIVADILTAHYTGQKIASMSRELLEQSRALYEAINYFHMGVNNKSE